MKKVIGIVSLVALLVIVPLMLVGCDEYTPSNSEVDREITLAIANELAANQPTPTDIDYSLERENLIRRAYWVNGQREKALAYPSAIPNKPLGYAILFTESGAVVGRFEVDGKVSSLNSYLSPDSEYYEKDGAYRSGETATSRRVDDFSNKWLADVDGSYGENDAGIFFFTPDGRYIEWTGTYLYSDIPFVIDNPVVSWEVD